MGMPIPSHIACQLVGRRFENFDHFCETFWIIVSEDPVLSPQFSQPQLNRMRKGWPPRAPFCQTVGGLRSYGICHLVSPDIGGPVYDMDNMSVMTPWQYATSTEIQE
ncbi:S-type pyocin [Pseudomonas wadenswilerensis]